MPSKRDNDEDRFNRIAALMEDYRVNHEDLVAYVNAVRGDGAPKKNGNQEPARKARTTTRRRS